MTRYKSNFKKGMKRFCVTYYNYTYSPKRLSKTANKIFLSVVCFNIQFISQSSVLADDVLIEVFGNIMKIQRADSDIYDEVIYKNEYYDDGE